MTVTLGVQKELSLSTLRMLDSHETNSQPKRVRGKIKIWTEPILTGDESYISRQEIVKRGRAQHALTGIWTADELLSYQDRFPKSWQEYFLVFPGPKLADHYRNTDLVPFLCRHPLQGRWWMQFVWIGHACAPKPKDPEHVRLAHFVCWKKV